MRPQRVVCQPPRLVYQYQVSRSVWQRVCIGRAYAGRGSRDEAARVVYGPLRRLADYSELVLLAAAVAGEAAGHNADSRHVDRDIPPLSVDLRPLLCPPFQKRFRDPRLSRNPQFAVVGDADRVRSGQRGFRETSPRDHLECGLDFAAGCRRRIRKGRDSVDPGRGAS